MAYRTPQEQVLTITYLTSSVQSTTNGNLFLECNSNVGRVAFWGTPADSENIDAVRRRTPPFRVRCGCIAPTSATFPGHAVWVPQNQRIDFIDEDFLDP